MKWIAIDADFETTLDDLLKLLLELTRDGIHGALEESRRGGRLWMLLRLRQWRKDARILRPASCAATIDKTLKGSDGFRGVELFPKKDRAEAAGFGSAIRAPLRVHRAVDCGY